MSVSDENASFEEGTYTSGLFPSAEPLPEQGVSACLVGGKRLVRMALEKYIESRGIPVTSTFADEEALAAALRENTPQPFGVIILLLSGGAFKAFHLINDVLQGPEAAIPLVVVTEQASRGQVYAALRIGAKAYVDLDAEPEELVRAIHMAAAGKVHLSPDAAQLLVDDITTATEPSHLPRLPSMQLSRREVEIVQLLCEGLSSKEVGRRLHISPKTVENHRYNIYRKCEVESIAGLMRHAIQHGLVTV
jgi:DNA-binding NarL/FixJ family response regulator